MVPAADADGFERQVGTDEVDEVAAPGAGSPSVGDVDGDEIHRYASDDRGQLAADRDGAACLAVGRACMAEDAVGVAGGDGGDAPRRGGAVVAE